MKKIILLAVIALFFANGYSQKKGGFRAGLDIGFIPASGGGGFLFSIEPKYNLADNMNVGLRIGLVGISKDVENNYDGTTSAKLSASTSFVGTYDYYFHKSGSSFAPYVGAGIGYYSLSNVAVEDTEDSGDTDPSVTAAIGVLLRGGFEWRKFRMGVEYNILPDSDMENIDGDKIGTAKNGYFGIHLGFFFGGGKWGK